MLLLLNLLTVTAALAAAPSVILPTIAPCNPESEIIKVLTASDPGTPFCSKWNPDFSGNGQKCCGVAPKRGKKRRMPLCKNRTSGNYCGDMTEDQKKYSMEAQTGQLGDILKLLTLEMGKKGEQAFCTVNNGFLANGRPVVSTPANRIQIHSPDRCLNFGTDEMAAMLEWLGREVGEKYKGEKFKGVQLVVGDISGPRGGCLVGRSGRRGHASHTSGQDADIGFITAKEGERSPALFHRRFDKTENWWFIKQIFKNPFACIKVIFLDQKHIDSLRNAFGKESEWQSLKKFIIHMRGHSNHMHVRIGKGPGTPGCSPGAKPEEEFEDDFDASDFYETSILDELRSRQSSSVK